MWTNQGDLKLFEAVSNPAGIDRFVCFIGSATYRDGQPRFSQHILLAEYLIVIRLQVRRWRNYGRQTVALPPGASTERGASLLQEWKQ